MSFFKKTLFWFPTIAWMFVIYVQSSSSPLTSSELLAAFGHFAEYSILSILFCISLVNTMPLRFSKAALLAIVFSASYGIIDEFHQLFVPTRFSDLNDIAIDVLSSIVGALVFALISGKRLEEQKR